MTNELKLHKQLNASFSLVPHLEAIRYVKKKFDDCTRCSTRRFPPVSTTALVLHTFNSLPIDAINLSN